MGDLNVRKEGRGPALVLSHALGCDLHMWDEVAALLSRRFTVVRYDHRGHGRSAPFSGPCTMDLLADDAAEVIRGHSDEAVHFVGLSSLGGAVAQRLAVRHPELVRSIVVANASSRYDDTARGLWRARIETVVNLGMGEIADGVMKRWFTAEFRDDARGAERVAAVRAVFEATDPRSYAAVGEAVSTIDFGGSNPLVACPALVIAGRRDESTPLAMAEAICNTISGAELATLETAHLSAVEAPAAFAREVSGFLERL